MKKGFINLILPITLFCFMGSFVKYVSYLTNANMRWLSSSILLIVVVLSKIKFINRFKKPEILIHLILCFWLILGSVWSDYAIITIYKSIAYILVSISIFFASSHWAEKKDLKNKLDFMIICLFLALLACIAGTIDSSISDYLNLSSAFTVYTGIVNNPNALGAMILMVLPYCLWKITISRGIIFKIFWSSCILILTISAFLSYARSSLIGIIFLLFIYLFSRKKSKIIISLITSLSILSIVFFNFQAVDDLIIDRYIYKSFDRDGSIIFSREENWKESFEAAKQGGLFGAGFGVAIGSEKVSIKGFSASASGYGREKGNGILAIVEESGLIGLGIATFFNCYLLLTARRAYIITKNIQERTLLIILFGAFFSISLFGLGEAYIVAPGTFEFAIYFAYLGALSGYSRNLIFRYLSK